MRITDSQPFSRNANKGPYDAAGRRARPRYRTLKHDFRAEKPCVLWESESIGRRRFKWPEEQRINRTIVDASQCCSFDASIDAADAGNGVGQTAFGGRD